ncbi:MAG TPA: acetylglutamate kinase [Bacteroidales bacterium]|nr:acetylglutamate kinase [Bacteroidales bacterium]
MKFNDNKKLILIKYGGNAMLNDKLSEDILNRTITLNKKDYRVVLVHGGGPFIKENLSMAGIKSEFIGGHRKTTPEAMKYIEMALKGEVNSKLVRIINKLGGSAVGLSGKDGKTALAAKRNYIDESGKKADLGQVGDLIDVDTTLLQLLLESNFLPVVTSVAWSKEGVDYNVNADMFAGFLAGKLKVNKFILLTDVDGLMEDPEKPDTLFNHLRLQQISDMEGTIIKGGMIPKTESCKIALELGAENAIITNGTKPDYLMRAIEEDDFNHATKITLS